MKPSSGSYRQRVGALIEDYICDKLSLTYNRRQRKYGYYDASDSNTIYEIKATAQKHNTFVIRDTNHTKLERFNGSYVFVWYILESKDNMLRVIDDIKILDITIVKAGIVTPLLTEPISKSTTNKNKKYWKVKVGRVHGLEGVENVQS